MSSPGPPPAAPTFEASKCAWIMARAVASFIETLLPGRGLVLGAGRRAAAQMVLAPASGGASSLPDERTARAVGGSGFARRADRYGLPP